MNVDAAFAGPGSPHYHQMQTIHATCWKLAAEQGFEDTLQRLSISPDKLTKLIAERKT